jgi:hypothetical protein
MMMMMIEPVICGLFLVFFLCSFSSDKPLARDKFVYTPLAQSPRVYVCIKTCHNLYHILDSQWLS